MSLAARCRPAAGGPTLPDLLKKSDRWVVWAWLKNRQGTVASVPGEGVIKMPYPVDPSKKPTTRSPGNKLTWTDPAAWGSFKAAMDRASQYAMPCGFGVGFVLGGGVVGIDLDHVRNPTTGELLPAASELVARCNTYTEVSPSGTGLKLYGLGEWPNENRNRRPLPGGGEIEVYGRGRFFTVTGNRVGEAAPLADLRPLLATLAPIFTDPTPAHPTTATAGHHQPPGHLGASAVDRATAYLGRMEPSVSGHRGHDRLYAACTAMVHGFELPAAEARDLILGHFNRRCQPEWSEAEIDHKLKDAAEKPHDKPRGYLLNAGRAEWLEAPDNLDDATTAPENGPARAAGAGGASPSNALRPQIIHKPAHLDIVLDAAMAAVRTANVPPSTFRHGDQFVRLSNPDEHRGSPIRAFNEHTLFVHLSRVAHWYEKVETKHGPMNKASYPPMAVAKAALHLADQSGLPKLSGWSDAPVFVGAGRLVSATGYDAASGYYILPSERPWVVEHAPTSAQTRAAVELILHELLGDFPFSDPADRANALALFLLPFCRGMINGPTPLHLVGAPDGGTGKSLLVQTWGEVVLGCPPHGTTPPEGEPEWAKVLVALLRNAPKYVFLENVEDIRSKHLKAALTNRIHSGRLLGASEMLADAVRCTWLATGNNVTQDSETVRRVCHIELDANSDTPAEGRTFRHELPQWATAERRELVTALLTIIQSWVAAGAKPGAVNVGSFEPWSRTLSGILAHAQVEGFMGNLTAKRQLHANIDDTPELFRRLAERFTGTTFGTKEILQVLIDFDLCGKELERSNTTAGRTAVVRNLIRKWLNKVRGGRKLVEADPDGHGEVKRYRLKNLNATSPATPSEGDVEAEDSFAPRETLTL